MSAEPKRILILSDGRAGHVSTSRGMADLLASEGSVAIDRLEIRLRTKALRPILKWLVNASLACRLLAAMPAWPRLFYRGYTAGPADVVISAGGDTIYLNALLGRCKPCPNIFCGSLRGVRANLFDLIVHIRPSDLPNWIAMEVLPSSAEMGAARAAADAFAQTHLSGTSPGYWSLLIGGDGSGYRFGAEDCVAILQRSAALAARHGKTLLVSTSRRTGKPAELAIHAWLAAHPAAPVAYCVLYNHTPERVATAFMALSEWVFCTEDSLSMISESVLLRRPLVTLATAEARPAPDHQTLLKRLAANRRLWRVGLAGIETLDMTAMADAWQPYERADQAVLRKRMLAILSPDAGASPEQGSPCCP